MDLQQVGYRAFEGTYRGEHVRLWGEHEDGGFKRLRRWWNVEACGQVYRGFSELGAAKSHAKYIIDLKIDGDWFERRWRDMFPDEDTYELAIAEPDKTAKMREKLEQMTVERGCTEAEAAVARKKLAEL